MIPHIIALIFLSHSSQNTVADSTDPGVKIRITAKGLNYASEIGSRILTEEIFKVHIPDIDVPIHKGPGKGSAKATNIHLTQFLSPTIWYKLQPPQETTWGSTGGTATVEGDWSARYKVLVTITGSGSFKAKAEDIAFEITGTVLRGSDGKPLILPKTCSAAIGHLNVHISGGFIGWIVNLFSSIIESQVKNQLKSTLCDLAMNLLNGTLNNVLHTLPGKINLNPVLTLDYTLTHDPLAFTDYVESYHKGEIAWKGESGTPLKPYPLVTSVDEDRMLFIWGSDYVMQSFLYTVYSHKVIQLLVNPETFPALAGFLAVDCPQLCIGTAFPQLKTMFPNKTVSMYVNATEQPQFYLYPGSAYLDSSILTSIFLSPSQSDNHTTVPLVTVLVKCSGSMSIRVDNDRLVGNLSIKDIKARPLESHIGPISQLEIDFLLIFLAPYLDSLANQYLKIGLPIPSLEGIRLLNPQVKMLNHTLQIQSDVQYKNY